jgi:hypothetical protein
MALHDQIQTLRDSLIGDGKLPVPDSLRGVTKERVAEVLRAIDRNHPDMVDAVFALLDNESRSWFAKAPKSVHFADGATTGQIACHIGILQRGKGKMDREGRDYWLKPLWEIGAIEKVHFDSQSCTFVEGHPVAKSANSAYRLAESFVSILTASGKDSDQVLADWISEKEVRMRLELQASLAGKARNVVGSKHNQLIETVVDVYVPKFLEGFEVLYVDDSDGDRISEQERQRLTSAGITLQLADAMPDVLLWNPSIRHLWVVEAVTSDGEVDLHKVAQIRLVAKRAQMKAVGFTTAYPTWQVAAARQGRHKNIAPGTFIWIADDPAKHFRVDGLNSSSRKSS